MPNNADSISAVRVEIVADSGTGGEMPSLLDVSAFLHDFNRLYEIIRLAFDEQYRDFEFKGPLAYREQRTLADVDRFYVESLRMASPLTFILFLLALRPKQTAQSVDILVKAMERLYNIPIEHRRRVAEVEEIEARARLLKAQAEEAELRNRERRETKLKKQSA